MSDETSRHAPEWTRPAVPTLIREDHVCVTDTEDFGGLFVTEMGMIGFTGGKAGALKWFEDITDVKGARVEGDADISANFGGTQRKIHFLGTLPGASLNVVDKAALRLPARHTFGLGVIYVAARIEYMQRVALPKYFGTTMSRDERAKEACSWWADLLKRRDVPEIAAPAGQAAAPGFKPIEPWVPIGNGLYTVDPHFVQGTLQRAHRELLTILRVFVGPQIVFGIFAVKLKGPKILMEDAIIAVGSENVTTITNVRSGVLETDPEIFKGAYDSIEAVEEKKSRIFMCGVDIAFRMYDELKWIQVVEMDREPARRLASMVEAGRVAARQ
jgi:hypothetical protein